jgi:hypothetical protein
MHSIMDPTVGTFAGSIVEPTDLLTEDIHLLTEDILLPLLPASEDILPASDNIPVRFTVGIVIRKAISSCLHTDAVSGERVSLAANPPQL